MDSIASYEAWKAQQQKKRVGAATVVLGASDTTPDQLAGDLNLASEFGKVTGNPIPPAPMVSEYRSVFQSAIEKTRAETILSSSPRLTEWLRNPENATLAKDDLEGLSWWETTLAATGNALVRAGQSVPQLGNQAMALEYSQDAADLQRSFGEILYDEREPIFDGNGKEVERLWARPGDLIGAAWRYYDSRLAGGMAAIGATDDPAQVAADYQMRAEEWRQKIAATPMSPGAEAVRQKLGTINGGTWQEQLSQFGQLVAEDPAGFLSFLGQVGLESTPAIAVSTGVGVVTRNPTAAAATMGSMSGAREYGASAGDVVAEAGYDLSTPEGALAAISDQALMRRAQEVGQTRALVIGALDGLSAGVAGKVLAENPLGNMLLQTLTQALFGSGGEAAAQFSAGQEMRLADILIEGLAEGVTAPLEVAGMGFSKVRAMQTKARDAEGRVTLFQELSGQSVASKLRARMPDRFRDFVERATANGPVESIYVPASEFARYFQTAGIDPYALVDELDGVTRDDLDAALAGGGDLKIPTATYAAKIAGSEHDAFLMENMRFDPLDMTAREAAEFNARVDDIMQEMWAEAEDIRQDDERWRAVEEKIHDQVVSQMRAAGLSTERAMAEVQPVVAFYRTRAARMGLTTEKYLARNPLPGIQGTIPQGMQFKNVDELNRTLAEARNRRGYVKAGRPAQTELVSRGGIDPSGPLAAELKARGVTPKTAPGLFRKGGLKNADNIPLADVPMMQNRGVDDGNGYVSEQAWIDALEAEGRQEAWTEVGEAAFDENDKYLDEIEAYLNRLGLDLDNSDEEIRQAIERDQAAPDRMYGQDGQIATESAAFKEWFGASKVVDADGKPLVVYHGTRADFEAFDPDQAHSSLEGFWFSNDKGYAEWISRGGNSGSSSKAGIVMPVYLSIKNPVIYDVMAEGKKIADEIGEPEPSSIEEAEAILKGPDGYNDIVSQLKFQNPDADGVIIRGTMDGFNRETDQYIAFEPTQIKSVFNRGTFDGNDPRILYQDGADTPLKRLLGGARERIAQRNATADRIAEAGRPVVMSDGGNLRVLVGPNTVAGEKPFRVTYLGADGKPNGHVEAETLRDAAIRAMEDGFLPGAGPTLFQNTQGPLGQISFTGDGQLLIRLFETANLSTLQHEMGHLFLTMMQRDVATGDQASIAEYEIIKSWWRENAKAVAADGNRAMPDAKLTAEDVQRAIDVGTTGDMMKDAAIDVGMQEQWARGYEAYLMEGKAPSVELRSAFEKFRAWMISVYRSLIGLNVQINDDIRGVFDRMLATDEEIAKAKQSAGENRPIFTTAEQMGLTQDEFDRLMKLRVQAEDEAKARLLREIMEPIKRQREAWWKEEKAKVEEDMTRQVNALPVFRALEWLGNRRWLGGDAPEGLPDMRMSKDMLIDRYGEGVLKTLPRGMQTVYTVEGGMDPDEVAGWFGFDSGDTMIRALERAPKRGDAIKAETDRVMNERHGDALNDGEIEAVALDALHTDKRGEWLAAELKAVAEVAGVDLKITMKDARATARATIARMKVRDATAAMRFLAAERKAGEEAARLGAMLAREGVWMQNARRRVATKARAALRDAGTVDAVAGQIDKANASTGNYNETVQKLIDAKRRQLINHALFMEARLAGEEIAKAEAFVKRLGKASMRERIAGAGRREGAQVDYLAAIDEILDLYDFRKMSGRAEQRRGALVAFVDAMKAAGRENELAIPEAVLRAAQMKPYKTLTVEELRGVIDSLKNLQHIALRWNDLIDAQNQRKLEEVVGEITAAFDANLPKRPPGRLKTTGEALRNSTRQFIDLVLNAGTILREIDGFADMGAAYRNLKAPIDQAMDRLTLRKEKAAADMEALYAVYSKDDRRKMSVRKSVPGIPFPMSKWDMIAVALNTGNEGNFQRLTDPNVRGSLTPDQVDVILNALDARDADFVQSVWDYIGSFRDDIAARERRTTGVEPAWVEAMPVDIAGKTLRGGYYPLKYDPRLSTLARDDEAQSMAEALQAGRFGKAQTKRGHLEARAQSSGRDIELDMSVLHRHVNLVIYDLELSEPVSNAWKVLQSGPVRQAFLDAGRQADFDALEIWLKDTAEGQLSAGDWLNRNARRFKSNFTAAKLAFNLGTVAAQITGLSQSMVVVGKRDFLRGLQASFRPGIMGEITAKSVFMRQRQTTFNKDIADFYSDPSLGPTASRWGEIKREWIGPASFWLMTKVQFILVDAPTWLGGYHQGLRMYGGDDAKAVEHADAIVKRAQASGLFSDRSAIERGSVSRTTRQNDVIRLFTTLGSYMFAKFNVAYERAARGGRVMRQEGLSVRSVQEAASLTLDMAFLFTVEAIIMAAIKGGLPGEEDDEEGNGTGDEWAAFLAKETAFSVLGTIPFVRDVASAGKGFEGGGAYGGITSELVKPFVEMGQGEVDKGVVKSVVNATGLFLGLPAAQMNRAIDAAWRELLEGEDVAPVEYLLGKRG